MDVRCPSCHSTFTLEQVAEDEALRELMGLIADLPREVSRPLAAYIGLFRGKTRATAYERQLRIAREVMAMSGDTQQVGAALSETVEAIRAKRDSGEDARPLKNHNYFKRVLESVGARPQSVPVARIEQAERSASPTVNAMPESKTRQAVNRLLRDRRG
jgi:prolyl-tRNA synthetase